MRDTRRIRRGVWLSAILLVASACTSSSQPREAVDEGPHALIDVAEDVGLDFRHGAFRWGPSPDPAPMMGGGLCWLDFDNDGWLDLFVVNSFADVEVTRWREAGGLPTAALFHNEAGRFVDVAAASGADLAVRGTGCVAADFNLDGDVDLFVTTERTDALLWNNGDGTFVEGASDAGVAAYGWHSGAAVGDLNADGWPDLVVAGYADTNYTNPDATEGFPDTALGVRDLLYLSNGLGDDGYVTFREVGAEAGLEAKTEKGGYEYGLGVVVFDVDRDADLDVYIANDTNPNRLYRNVLWPGGVAADPSGLGFRFEDVSTSAGVDRDKAGMGLATGDFDGNGIPDFFATNARLQGHDVLLDASSEVVSPLYIDGAAAFDGVVFHTGWGVSWLDLDNDTDLDLVLANGDIPITDISDDAGPLQAFVNVLPGGVEFRDASDDLGLPAVGSTNGRGVAAGDFDNDGDLDVAVNSIGGRLILLENRGVTGNWLEVGLVGFHPGAIIVVTLGDGRELVRDILAGSSYLSSEDPRAQFGLGDAETVAEVVVNWPDGQRTRIEDVASNQLITFAPPRG